VIRDEVLRFGSRLCVPDVPELKREVLDEVHCSAYTVHLRYIKICGHILVEHEMGNCRVCVTVFGMLGSEG